MTVRVCLVGAGRVATVHARSIREWLPGVAAVAVVEPVAEVAGRMTEYLAGAPSFETLDRALEAVEFDAVVITTPTFTHRELAVAAAGAGKHVFCEKPMALNVAECDAMIGRGRGGRRSPADRLHAALPAGVRGREGADPGRRDRRADADQVAHPGSRPSPALGSPARAQQRHARGGQQPRFRHRPVADGLATSPASTRRPSTSSSAAHGITDAGFYDIAVVALRFASRGIGTIDGACPAEYGYDARVEVLGTKGVIVVGEMQGQPIVVANNRNVGLVSPIYRTWPERFAAGYIGEMRHFVEAIATGSAPIVGGLDGRCAVEAVMAANRSWQEERPVRIGPAGRD